jgi:hypothetical protein
MIITFSSSSDGRSPLWLKNKKFLRKTLGQPKGSGFFRANFVAFLTRKLGKFGNFFVSLMKPDKFCYFLGNFHQIFNITKLEEKKTLPKGPL